MSLPNEILVDEILPRMPAKSICRFKTVCKEWLKVTRSELFISLHREKTNENKTPKLLVVSDRLYGLENYCFDDDDRIILHSDNINVSLVDLAWNCSVVGSCNGLILMAEIKRGKELYLINPSTKACRDIGYPSFAKEFSECWTKGFDLYGVGQDDSGDYIAAHILGVRSKPSHEEDHYLVSAFNVRTDSWSLINRDSTIGFDSTQPKGVFLDGSLHWLVLADQTRLHYILSLNLTTLKFGCKYLPMPTPIGAALFLYKRYLTVVPKRFERGCTRTIWILMDSHWYSVDLKLECTCSTLCVWNSSLVLTTNQRRALMLYDLDQDEASTTIEIEGTHISTFSDAEPYIDSLEPL